MRYCLMLLVLGLGNQVFGANGANFISISPVSRGMGGTGTSHHTSVADNLHKNLALLGSETTQERRFAVETSLGVAKLNASANMDANGAQASSASATVLPNIALEYRVNEAFSLGLGIISSGGSNIDHKSNPSAFAAELKTKNLVTRWILGFGSELSEQVSFGAGVFMTGALLSLNSTGTSGQTDRPLNGATGVGVQLGLIYRILKSLHFGASYFTATRVTYPTIIDLDAFGPGTNAALDNIDTQQPAEFSAALSYTMGRLLLALDYRYIGWGSADTFKELGWNDQHVFAVGAQYAMGRWRLRTGFNWAKSPIRTETGESGFTSISVPGNVLFKRSISIFNLVAIPGIAETHFTGGVGWLPCEDLSLDVGFSWAPAVTKNRTGTFPVAPTTYDFTAEVSQWVLAAGATLKL